MQVDTARWQRRLRRDIGWLLLAKLCGLGALWALFFSPAHRVRADAQSVADRLSVTAPAVIPNGALRRD